MLFLSKKKAARIFTEWLRRFKETPDEFDKEFPDNNEDYGTNASNYFFKLSKEV